MPDRLTPQPPPPPAAPPGLGHNGGPALDDVLSATVRNTCKMTGWSKDKL
jgi:hypothetical protein